MGEIFYGGTLKPQVFMKEKCNALDPRHLKTRKGL
jgi:hypothetical protein